MCGILLIPYNILILQNNNTPIEQSKHKASPLLDMNLV